MIKRVGCQPVPFRQRLGLSTELTSAISPDILWPIEETNDDEQEEYAHSSPPREPAAWCEAGASAGAEWPWESQSEPILDFGF